MSDGAHFGVSAERAIETILGGKETPSPDEQMTVSEFREWIMQPDQEPLDYSETARRQARIILTYFLADPTRASLPGETVYDWEGDPDHGSKGMKPEYLKALGLYEVMKEDGVVQEEGLTGFQWGWALNAARRCVELGPVANPAIIDIEVSDD
jgi:hypothetical protein